MSRTEVDLEKVIGHLNDCMEASRRDNTWVFVRKDIVEDALALLKEQEAVVRCKDCKYWTVGDFGPFCPYHHDARPDWFCADGIEKDTDYDPIWD